MKTLPNIAALAALTVGWGLPMPAHAETPDIAVLDLNSGELLEGIPDEEIESLKVSVSEIPNGHIIDLSATQAKLTFRESQSETNPLVIWYTPGCDVVVAANTPEVNGYAFNQPVSDDIKDFKLTVLEAEYKDFDYQLGVSSMVMSPYPEGLTIEPYSGFLPSTIGDDATLKTIGPDSYGFHVWLPITQYDYEHEVVRAYTHLKVRVDYLTEESAAAEVEAAETPARYFNLQGIEVSNPKVGDIYIEWQGHNARKRRL